MELEHIPEDRARQTLTAQIALFTPSYGVSSFAKWLLCDISAACSASASVIAVKKEEGSISVFVLPGLGLKWQWDQLCVESQSFFMLPAAE